MFLKIFTLLYLAGSALALSSFYDLKRTFNTEYSSVFLAEGITGKDLESTVKDTYRRFLMGNSLAQKDRIDSYFREWKKVVDVYGPLKTDEKRSSAFKKLMNPPNFMTELYMETLLENRDDSQEAIPIFKRAMISQDTAQLTSYLTGDGDIIGGVIIASLKNNGDLHIVTTIFD